MRDDEDLTEKEAEEKLMKILDEKMTKQRMFLVGSNQGENPGQESNSQDTAGLPES